MADYQLTANDDVVFRTTDSMWIPNDPANTQWQEYQQWLADGGVPDPYVEPPPPEPPPPSNEQLVLYDHENRLRLQEGTPPLDLDQFMSLLRA